MKAFFSFSFLFFLLLVALVCQDLFAPIASLGQAKLLFVPLIFCFAALALPLSQALLFALATAVFEGLMVMHSVNDHVEIRLGWFIFFFMIWTVLLQFTSELTSGIRWEVHALGSALCTGTFLAGEFLLLAFDRGHFSITIVTFLLIAIPSGAALLLAPLCYAMLQFLLPPAKAVPTAQHLAF